MNKRILLALNLSLLSGTAFAQSSPGLSYGYVPTAGEWNSYFAAKQDYLGSPPLLLTGGQLSGKLVTAPPTALASGFNLTPGVTPTSPNNGDLWSTSAGVFAQVNGTTVGPFGVAGAGSGTVNAGTAGQIAYYPSSSNAVSGVTSIPLANGGLGGSQSGATANQIPVYPGTGGAASPTTIGGSGGLFDAICSSTVGQAWVRLTGGWGCLSLGYANPMWWGASGSSASTTGTISASSTSLLLASSSDFANGQGIRINHAGAAFTLNQPTSLSVTPTGSAGSTTYSYKIASLDGAGGVGLVTTAASTTTGNMTLSATNYNAMSWTAPTGSAPNGYAIYKSIAGVYTLIGVSTTTSFNDYGFTSYGVVDWIPATAAGAALADNLITTISSGAGTTTLTLANAATTAASSSGVLHDDTAAFSAAVSASSAVYVPPGSFRISSPITGVVNSTFSGAGSSTRIIVVNVGDVFFNAASGISISGLTIDILPGETAINLSSGDTFYINNIRCNGPGFCIQINNSSFVIVDNIFLDSSEFGATAPATIFVSDNGGPTGAIHLNHIQATNNGSQVLVGSIITFNDSFNSDITNSYLSNEISNQPNSAGIQIEGNSQGIVVSNVQILGFGADMRIDSAPSGSPAGVLISNSLFDFCQPYCLLLVSGSVLSVNNSLFEGERTDGAQGIIATASFSGPIVAVGNNFDDFSGSGATPININSAITSGVSLIGNQFVNSGSNASYNVANGVDISPPIQQSWTPAITLGGGSTGLTYTSRAGWFVRDGHSVTAYFDIRLSALGSSTGTVAITGLPFTVNTGGQGAPSEYFNMTGISGAILLNASAGGTVIDGVNIGTTTGVSAMTNSNLTNSTIIVGHVIYTE